LHARTPLILWDTQYQASPDIRPYSTGRNASANRLTLAELDCG